MGKTFANLYNLDSFDAFQDSIKEGTVPFNKLTKMFNDSAYNGVVLARNLTAVDPKIFEKKFPANSFLNSSITIDNTGEFAKQIESLRTIVTGEFKDATDRSEDKGKIGLKGENNLISVFERTANARWSKTELKRAGLQRISLVSMYMSAMNSIYQRELDYAYAFGVGSQKGLINNSIYTSVASSDTLANLTPKELYDELAGYITDQWNGCGNVAEWMGNEMFLPSAVYNTASTSILSTTGDSTESVLAALIKNFPTVKFIASERATACVLVSTNSEAVAFRLPVPLTIGDTIQVSSFNFSVDGMYLIGGIDILERTSGRILTGLVQ